MINWTIQPVRSDGSTRRFCGTSRATSGDELCADFQELWLALFNQQLRWYPPNRWDSILGSLQIWHGTIDLEPCLGLDLHKQLPGCGLTLEALRTRWHETPAVEIDEVTHKFEQLVCTSLMLAFQRIVDEEAVRATLSVRELPFTLLSAPDAPPLIETVLR